MARGYPRGMKRVKLNIRSDLRRLSFVLISVIFVFAVFYAGCAYGNFRLDDEGLLEITRRYFNAQLHICPKDLDAVKIAGDIKADGLKRISWVCIKEDHALIAISEIDKVVYGGWTVATGRNPGQKTRVGDLRTPEGVFRIKSIEDASYWGFYEDKATGQLIGYGPYFIRLETKWKGIGIHGTDEAHIHEIGTNASHGCIRMANDDLLEVVRMAKVGQKVVILPSL